VAEEGREVTLTPQQVKTAQELLEWSQADLARRVGVSAATVSFFEIRKRRMSKLDLNRALVALESAGVIFVDENGAAAVRLMTLTPNRLTTKSGPIDGSRLSGTMDKTELYYWSFVTPIFVLATRRPLRRSGGYAPRHPIQRRCQNVWMPRQAPIVVPACGEDQRFERCAVVALQQFDHAGDFRPLPGRRRHGRRLGIWSRRVWRCRSDSSC
jgi:transcriptional regulator with XRE-family HTH domain